MKTFKDELSIRCINGLARCFGRQTIDTPEVIAKCKNSLTGKFLKEELERSN